MTGTAKTEEKEFVEIYGLNVVEIPTNVAVARLDENDLVFRRSRRSSPLWSPTSRSATRRASRSSSARSPSRRPSTSPELLTRKGVKHNVLNAKEHAREAEIIKDAGQRSAVTIATNMAGRGVDIKLDDRVRDLGGLYVLGTERHESRRIDNQLRGRSGRQGDPGETRFYLSGRTTSSASSPATGSRTIMDRFKIPDDQPMEAKILSRQIEGAQKKVEEQNFVMRKNVLKYDDVINRHRAAIYEQRRQVLDGEDLSEQIKLWIDEVVEDRRLSSRRTSTREEWDLEALAQAMAQLYGTEITATSCARTWRSPARRSSRSSRRRAATSTRRGRRSSTRSLMRDLERFIVLQVVDLRWREHLENMEVLREGIHLRHGAEGSARRVPGEGQRCSRRWAGAIRERGRAAPLPRGARRPTRRRRSCSRAPTSNGAERPLTTSTSPRRAPRRSRPQAVDSTARHGSAGGGVVGRPRCVPTDRQLGAREHRPQRPLLVRHRQEVQEVPRRLAR